MRWHRTRTCRLGVERLGSVARRLRVLRRCHRDSFLPAWFRCERLDFSASAIEKAEGPAPSLGGGELSAGDDCRQSQGQEDRGRDDGGSLVGAVGVLEEGHCLRPVGLADQIQH